MRVDRDRCKSVDDGARCQLYVHDDGQHVAMVRFDVHPARAMRQRAVAEYRRWGQLWTKPEPGQAPLPWAPTMPMVE